MICTLGDLLLDVVVRLDEPIVRDTDNYGAARAGAGGQAANVAVWVAALGGRARFIGKRARDRAGRLVADEVESHGVELAGPEVSVGTGTVVSIVTADGRRTMLTDRGVAPDLAPGEIDPAWLEGCEWLHVAGYSLVRTPIRDAALAAARMASGVSLDLSSQGAIEEIGVEEFRAVVAELGPEVVFANEQENDLVGPVEGELILKRGPRGARIGGTDYPAPPVHVLDTTGAGDAFAAGYLVGGPELAMEAAAKCVEMMGALP